MPVTPKDAEEQKLMNEWRQNALTVLGSEQAVAELEAKLKAVDA